MEAKVSETGIYRTYNIETKGVLQVRRQVDVGREVIGHAYSGGVDR
jgi:hypothetical protein